MVVFSSFPIGGTGIGDEEGVQCPPPAAHRGRCEWAACWTEQVLTAAAALSVYYWYVVPSSTVYSCSLDSCSLNELFYLSTARLNYSIGSSVGDTNREPLLTDDPDLRGTH